MGKQWFRCQEDPPETGKKVLVCCKGDIYVAMRFFNVYLPMPFFDHYHSTVLSKPEIWSEIDFPPGLDGKMRIMADGRMMEMPEWEEKFPEEYVKFANNLIACIGSLKQHKEIALS